MSRGEDGESEGFSRRKLLIGGGIGAGLLVGWSLWPRTYAPNLPVADGEHLFGPYLKISENGEVIIAVPQSEMGQGIYTSLAQIVAGELGADWRTVAVQPALVSPLYANKLLAREWAPSLVGESFDPDQVDLLADRLSGSWATRNMFMVTADSTSIRQFEQPCREAGATARALLCMAAADRWDTDWESCEAANGFVTFEKKRLSFGELAAEAADYTPPSPPPLRASPVNALSGKDMPRLDLAAKVDGSASFAADVRLPDMLYASIRRGPIGDTSLKSIKKKATPKNVTVVSTDKWVAALANNWWAANRALDLIAPVFETRGVLADSGRMMAALEAAFKKGRGWRLTHIGSVDSSMQKEAATRVFASDYLVAPALHTVLETRSATAHYHNGRLQLWIATQAPQAAREAAAQAIGISADDVIIYSMFAGGSFGRNLDNEIAAQVAVLSKHVGRPVQLTWSRPEDFIRDAPRTPAAAHMIGALDTAGRLNGLAVQIAVPATAREQVRRLTGDSVQDAIDASAGEYDVRAVEGALPPYNIPNLSVEHFPVSLRIPTGNWRSNSHSYTSFFVESFIDEMAHQAGVEPLSYRMQMLVGQTRLARCLTGVATMAGWDGGAQGSGKGIACHSMRGSHIAIIASARTDATGVRVTSISAMVDCGRLISPDIARQQIEGGIVFGLAQALGGAAEYSKGLPDVRRLRDLDLPLLGDIPEITVEFIRSDEAPGGVAELGVPATAPAIANALFSAAGVRMRELPLLSRGL